MPNARRFAYPFLLAVVVLGIVAVPGRADLSSKYQAGQSRAKQLRSEISAQSQTIEGYQGTIDNLQTRLNAIENALDLDVPVAERAERLPAPDLLHGRGLGDDLLEPVQSRVLQVDVIDPLGPLADREIDFLSFG